MFTCKLLHLMSKPFPKPHGNIYVVSQLSGARTLHASGAMLSAQCSDLQITVKVFWSLALPVTPSPNPAYCEPLGALCGV